MENNYVALVEVLLQHNASTSAVNREGQFWSVYCFLHIPNLHTSYVALSVFVVTICTYLGMKYNIDIF